MTAQPIKKLQSPADRVFTGIIWAVGVSYLFSFDLVTAILAVGIGVAACFLIDL